MTVNSRSTAEKFTLSRARAVKVNFLSKPVSPESNVEEKSLERVELSSAGARLSERSKNLVRPGPASSANCLTLPCMMPFGRNSNPGGNVPVINS